MRVYHGRRVQNFELARLFYEMATLLEVRNESVFRVRAYQRAAQMLESLTEDIAAVAARGGLQKLPGIGKDLAIRVEEFLNTGRIDQLEAMRRDVPPRFLTLLEIRGLPIFIGGATAVIAFTLLRTGRARTTVARSVIAWTVVVDVSESPGWSARPAWPSRSRQRRASTR